MTNYNDGEWHGWNGGECPVHPETVVDMTYWDGVAHRSVKARQFQWTFALLFRVVKEHKEPREFWAKQFSSYAIGLGKPMEKLADTWTECGPDDDGATLFREVQP